MAIEFSIRLHNGDCPHKLSIQAASAPLPGDVIVLGNRSFLVNRREFWYGEESEEGPFHNQSPGGLTCVCEEVR